MTFFTPYNLDTAAPEAQTLLQGIKSSYGFIPNLFTYMAAAPVTIEAYLALNQLIGKSSLSPAQAQTALLAASLANNCDFCAVAHRAMGKKAGVKSQTVEALLNQSPINDPKDHALVELVQLLVRERGQLADGSLQTFFAAGFNQQQVFELILVVTIKTLSNYINHLTKPEVNPELIAML